MNIVREALSTLGLLFAAVVALTHYAALPQKIPGHFDAYGHVSGYSDKSSLWLLVAIACFVYGVLTLIPYVPKNLINLPVRLAQREAAMPLAMEMVGWLKVGTMWMFGVLCLTIVRVAIGRQDGLNAWFLPLMLIALFGMIGYYLWRMVRLPG